MWHSSGTAATPGVAGVGALMLQANLVIPFDIRNILQEQAAYHRLCPTRGANRPCARGFDSKNERNNVYGHGHVNALES